MDLIDTFLCSFTYSVNIEEERQKRASKRPKTARKRKPAVPRVPKIVATLKQAMAFQARLDSREVPSQADLARETGMSRARITQIMNLLKLHPRIRETILGMADSPNGFRLGEHHVRPLMALSDENQLSRFQALITGLETEVTQG